MPGIEPVGDAQQPVDVERRHTAQRQTERRARGIAVHLELQRLLRVGTVDQAPGRGAQFVDDAPAARLPGVVGQRAVLRRQHRDQALQVGVRQQSDDRLAAHAVVASEHGNELPPRERLQGSQPALVVAGVARQQCVHGERKVRELVYQIAFHARVRAAQVGQNRILGLVHLGHAHQVRAPGQRVAQHLQQPVSVGMMNARRAQLLPHVAGRVQPHPVRAVPAVAQQHIQHLQQHAGVAKVEIDLAGGGAVVGIGRAREGGPDPAAGAAARPRVERRPYVATGGRHVVARQYGGRPRPGEHGQRRRIGLCAVVVPDHEIAVARIAGQRPLYQRVVERRVIDHQIDHQMGEIPRQRFDLGPGPVAGIDRAIVLDREAPVGVPREKR